MVSASRRLRTRYVDEKSIEKQKVEPKMVDRSVIEASKGDRGRISWMRMIRRTEAPLRREEAERWTVSCH
ncbi:hypothetical protein K0M31_009255 [Melipona bicolor]|uniref:Uncharacterized protein n=1 Tax=Melipona bicolor TaxID=60889 RepID=A0AA40KJK9_9HYME|nr:hypothetical protein K0M31_009255 [Melipona bicolor]